MEYQIEIYRAANGKKPFDTWFESLKDPTVKALILNKLDKVKQGNLGDATPVGSGVSEFRLHSGPGFRLYFAKIGKKIILLLCGGSKSTQQKDIMRAKQYLQDFKIKGVDYAQG